MATIKLNNQNITGIVTAPVIIPDASVNPNAGMYGTPTQESYVNSLMDVSSRVKNSPAYQSAYKIFSSDEKYGAPYLQRLELIPGMAQTAHATFWEDIGLSKRAEDKNYASYELAMEQIGNLVAEYYEFINTLPVTQVSQMLDAGVYGAAYGVGVDGSDMNPKQATTKPSQLTNTDPMEVITSLGNLALSFCSGPLTALTSAWSAIQGVRQNWTNVGLTRDRLNLDRDKFDLDNKDYLSKLWTTLDSAGYNMSSTSFESFDDFISWADTFSVDDPHAKLKRSTASKDSTIMAIYDKSLEPFRNRESKGLASFGGDFERFYLDLGNFQIDQAYNAIKFRSAQDKFNANYMTKLNPDYRAASENAVWQKTAFESYFTKKLEEEKLSFFKDQLEKIKKSNDPVAKFAVTQLMFKDPLLSKVALATEVSTPLINAAKDAAMRVNDPSNPAFYLEDM